MVIEEQRQTVEELPEYVSKISVSDFFQTLNSKFNNPTPSKLTFLHINNTKVFCLPCKSCTLLPKPTQRAFVIICCHSYMHDRNVKSERIQEPEPARSSVGEKILLHEEEESDEVNSSKQQLSAEGCGALKKELDFDTTQHSHTGNVTLAVDSHKRKQLSPKKIKRTTDKSIGLEDLQQHFGKRRKEAAKSLSVSVSTLTRIARQYGIPSWPYSKMNKGKGAEGHLNQTSLCILRPVNKSPESIRTEFPCETHPKKSAIKWTDIQTPPQTAVNDLTIKAVKVKFGNEIVRFEMSALSKMVDLEEEVAKRLKLEMGSFNVSYWDEDKDLVLIACDADLWYCMRLLGRMMIRMVVTVIQNDGKI